MIFKMFSTIRGLNLPWRVLTQRTVYTDAYLGIDKTASRVSKKKLLIQEPAVFKEKLKADYKESGLSHIDSGEIMLLGETKEDFVLAQNLIEESLNPGDNGIRNLLLYFRMCTVKNFPCQAQAGWNSPLLKSATVMESNNTIQMLYFNILYKNNMYQEVLDEFLTKQEHYLNMSNGAPKILTVLSCYKLSTKESLKHSINILSLASELNRKSIRCNNTVALLAYNLGEYDVAFDILRKYGRTNSLFRCTIEIMILAASGQLEEAVAQFKVRMVPKHKDETNRQVLYCGVVNLINAIKERGDQEMLKEVMEMVVAMDETVTVRNETLEESILKPIKLWDNRSVSSNARLDE